MWRFGSIVSAIEDAIPLSIGRRPFRKTCTHDCTKPLHKDKRLNRNGGMLYMLNVTIVVGMSRASRQARIFLWRIILDALNKVWNG